MTTAQPLLKYGRLKNTRQTQLVDCEIFANPFVVLSFVGYGVFLFVSVVDR